MLQLRRQHHAVHLCSPVFQVHCVLTFAHALRDHVVMLDGLQQEQPASNGNASPAQASSPGKS